MGLISRVSSRTYREVSKMAARQIIKRTFFSGWKKPFPTQDVQSINITKIQRDNLDNPQGPFCDPFVIPARNQFRMMWENVDMYGDFRPFKCWWLYEEGDGFTENNMMRSPFSGRYFKLAYDPTDYYGVDQVDMHSHAAHQY